MNPSNNTNSYLTHNSKISIFGHDKNLSTQKHLNNQNSLSFWINKYFNNFISRGKEKTKLAKKIDLQKFLDFFFNELNTYHIDHWTPSISKGFQEYLLSKTSQRTKKQYKATTINRILATLKHCANWINERRSFEGGLPFEGVKDLMQDEPDWNGLTDRQLMLLKSAIDKRIKICNRKDQNPLLEAAVFYTLLHTGLRKFELCSLNLNQYHSKALHDIRRKGNMITKKVFLSSEARNRIDKYLVWRNNIQTKLNHNYLFINKNYEPLSDTAVTKICKRLSKQACVNIKDEESFILEPHQLRHTCLKRANDKYGIAFAKKLSGNVGDRELYRYTAPSQQETQDKIEGLF